MSQKIKNAQKFLSNIVRKSIQTQKNRKHAHNNFVDFSKGMKEVSNYNRLIRHSKRAQNPRQTKISNNMPTTTDELENKLTNYKELYLLAKEELSEVKKNEENRLRMIREDLKAFEEKRREIISARERRHMNRDIRFQAHQKYSEDDKFNYINVVINHLKLYLGISPEDICINNMADESLERSEAYQRLGWGIRHPYQIRIVDLTKESAIILFSGDVTREEYIDALKKGISEEKISGICLEEMKRKLLDKTIDIAGRGYRPFPV